MKYIFFFFFFLSAGALWPQAEEPLYLNITFPTQSDTVNADRIRISGHTHTDALVRINNQKIDLFPQGSFATRVDLAEGMNQIILTAQKNDELVRDILFVYRPPRRQTLSSEPTEMSREFLKPESDVWLMRGDFLTVEFHGSPGGQATFSVEKLAKDMPMVELPGSSTNGVAGVYQGTLKLDGAPHDRSLDIEFELVGLDGRKKRRQAPGKLIVMSDDIPRIGHTTGSTFMHATSSGYTPFTRLPDSIAVHITGYVDGRYRIDLIHRTAFIDAEDVKLDPPGTPLPRTTIAAPYFQQDKEWFHLIMPIAEKVPFQTRVHTNPLRVELTVLGARQASHWITYPNTAIDLVDLKLEQKDEHIFFVSAELNQKKSWGHKVVYHDGALRLSIRRQPLIDPQHPFRHIIFSLDPGHGGEETGAVSPLGVFEKDVNWKWAHALATLLRRQGALVFLTRAEDETVSLPERVSRAQQVQAHFYLSLHNNATSAAGNPLTAQGTSVYFTRPENKDLNWAIYPHMVKLGLSPYGRIHNSYFVTNATPFLVALVEGGFLTNPYEELKLADDVFIERMARAVYDGLVDFLRSQTE